MMVHLDAIVVAIAMIIGFSVIMMKFTGFWPCRIAEILHIGNVSCDKTFAENMKSIETLIRNSTNSHFGSQFLHNILLR
jgi:hypothetical protein